MDEKLNKKDSTITREKKTGLGFQLLVIFIVLTMGIGASGYFYYKSQAKQLREGINDQLNAVSDLKVNQIVTWRDDRIEDATILLKQSSFVPFVHQWLENPADSNLKEKVSTWMNIFQEDKNYKAVFLADAQGNTRLSLPQRDKQLSACVQPHFAEALRTRKIIFTDFYFVATTHRIHLALIIPLFDSDTAPFGFIVLEIDPYKFLYPFIQTWPTPSKTAETLLVRREGNEVVFLNDLRHRKNTALTLKESLSQKNMPAVMAAEGKTGIVEGVDYQGKRVLAVLRAVPGSPWYLVTKVDQDEIDTGIKNQTRLLGIVFSLLFFCSGTIVLFVWRHQRSQFYKKQYATERKLAIEHRRGEEALKKSTQLLRDTGEMAKVGGWELDLSTKEVSWTEEVTRIHGVEPGYKPKLEEALNFYAPESRPALEEALQKIAETGEPYDVESLFIPSGSKDKIWVRSLGKAVYSGGKIVKLAGTFQNIDKYKQAEEALRESEERYRTLFEMMDEGFCVVEMLYDPDGKAVDYRFVEINPAFEKHTGLQQALGKTIRQMVPNHDAHWFEIYGKVARTGEAIRFENPAHAMQRYYGVFAFRIGGDGSQRVGVFFNDITDHKRAEAERERLLAEIAAKNEELESFVYTISHDLRAPLVSLDGFSSLLKRESQNQLGKQGQHYLERIRANVAHMNALVTELFELSRIGRVVGPEEEIDMGVLLREIEEGMALKLEQEGVEFIVQQPLPVARGDRGRIRQVFANLIENAVKFRSIERCLRIEVGCKEEKGFYRFHVRDNGIGIFQQYQEQIFEPFRQLDNGIDGVGMGLALVKRIVEHHGGRIWVESETGKGSTFYFRIPNRTTNDLHGKGESR